MHDVREAVFGEQRRHAVTVGEIELNELEVLQFLQLVAPRFLELRIVVGVQVVEADDRAAVLQQALGHVEPDEAGRAGDENGLYRRHRSIPFGFCARSSFDLTSSTMPSPPLSSLVTKGQPFAT